ncbi:MAG: barstar family protein [Chitinophagales bacterium]|nr:barstar family protein [Chitinophagales bacterium]MCZ2392669.1 barstar family protein [Chitinophagales bacterium]
MKSITINFNEVNNIDEFYLKIKNELSLPEYFGNNLDALYDVLTSGWNSPIELKFVHLSPIQLIQFKDLIDTLKEIENELDSFSFDYYITLK